VVAPPARRLFLGLSAALLLALPAACAQDPAPLPRCGQIPGEGCPIGRGGTCDDRTCTALYDCQMTTWVLVQTCTGNGVGGGGGGGGSLAAGGGGSCPMPKYDLEGQLPSERCDATQQLMSPDCPIEAGETCAQSVCLTGCTDFFICKNVSGELTWIEVAYCDCNGDLVIDP
jgi:hypothetical protein